MDLSSRRPFRNQLFRRSVGIRSLVELSDACSTVIEDQEQFQRIESFVEEVCGFLLHRELTSMHICVC